MKRRVVALAPINAPFNRFSGLFADAVERTGAEVRPYGWGLRALMACDVVIYHWPHFFMDPSSLKESLAHLARLRVAQRTKGVKLVWVAHNVVQHDALSRHPIVRRLFVGGLDGVIYLSHASREIVRSAYRMSPRVRELVTVHGVYADAPASPFVPPAPGEATRLTSIGLVRPYKNLDELAAAAGAISPAVATVTIRGKRHDREYAARLEEMTGGGGALRMALSDDLLTEAELEQSIDEAHGVVLPYRTILNSGSAIHALSRGRPVLVPALGSMPELAAQIGSDWVQLYDGTLTPDRLAAFAAHVRALPAGATPDLEPLSWSRVERDLARFLDQLTGSSAAAPARANLHTAREAGEGV